MTSFFGLWRTTTVRLTALFIAIFIVFAVALLGLISYQIAISIQRQQSVDIEREIALRGDVCQHFLEKFPFA